MRNYASLQALIQELENGAGGIERLRSRNETAWERIRQGANDPVDWGALGFTIQTLYGEDLDPAKTRDIQEVVESFFQTFPALHQRFIARLRSIADAL